MKIYDKPEDILIDGAVVTTGFFDGVHIGHCSLINELNRLASELGGASTVITFWPHPRWVTDKQKPLKLLNTLEEKKMLLAAAGLKNLVILPFNNDFSAISAREYIESYLLDKLRMRAMIVGYNHRFGRGREGDFSLLSEYAVQHDFVLKKLEAINYENQDVSSTIIRNTLEKGDIANANRYLGYSYFITGIVVKGRQLGRTIGYPTANLQLGVDYKLIPLKGVYAVRVILSGKSYKAMLNIGHNPTMNHTLHPSVEVHILDFDGDIYGQSMRIEFVQRLRSEYKFDGVEALKKQLDRDKQDTLNLPDDTA